MNLEVEAQAFIDRLKAVEWKGWHEAFKALPKALAEAVAKLRYAAKRNSINEYFVPENAGESHEKLSPSGLYKLKITRYTTTKGGWSYSQGLVFRQGSDEPIAEIRRNYTSFPFSWIENHPNGHPYLVCGEDYQGQTVIELDTGKRRDFVPVEAAQGAGFCWSSHEFHAETSTLVVDGCYWACPYEFRFYDFSDPMSGWPEIKFDDAKDCYAYADQRHPTFEADGTIKTYQTEDNDDDLDDDSEEEKLGPIAAIKTFRRDGLKLLLVDEWVSDKEQNLRAAREEAERKYEEWIENYRANDPLYVAMKTGVAADATFKPGQGISVGFTHDSWCPGHKFEEKRICRRIHQGGGTTVDIEIAEKTGPVKLELYRDGNKVEDKFFMEHTVESVTAALAYAKTFIGAA
jgi:hypothetical protein